MLEIDTESIKFRYLDELDLLPESEKKNSQVPTIRAIVEDRIISLNEELFFLDAQ